LSKPLLWLCSVFVNARACVTARNLTIDTLLAHWQEVESRNLAADAAAGAGGGYRGAADVEASAQKAMRLLSRRNLDAERLGQDVHALELQVTVLQDSFVFLLYCYA
jgi:hypothetical protein